MEDKKDIVIRLKVLLMATRAGRKIDTMILSEDQSTVTVQFKNGCKKEICVEADSGIALIRDVMKAID